MNAESLSPIRNLCAPKMHITLLIIVHAVTCAALDLISIAKLVRLQVATNRYLKSSKPSGINLMSTDKFLLVNSHLVFLGDKSVLE